MTSWASPFQYNIVLSIPNGGEGIWLKRFIVELCEGLSSKIRMQVLSSRTSFTAETLSKL